MYHSYDLDHWNVWGSDNAGKINANGSKFFYIKDHLGSVRMVLNSDNQIVLAIDYDCWGYPLENRSYQSDDINYKFTGKQRDAETGYDYFGARYYDARIGRWGGVELVNKNIYSSSPYSYAFSNPVAFIDTYGFYPRIWQEGNTIYIQTTYYYVTDRDDKNNGLNQSQIDKVKKMVENMNKWSGTFKTKDGKELKLSVKVTMHNINRPFDQSLNYYDMVDILREYFKDGFSFIQNVDKINNSKSNRGVSHEEGGDVMHVTRDMDPYETTGGHEFGHSLFLEDENSNSDVGKIPSIMQPVDIYPNGDIKRNSPEMEDRLKVYEMLKINKIL